MSAQGQEQTFRVTRPRVGDRYFTFTCLEGIRENSGNPGMPVSVTGLKRILAVIPSRISRIASSERVETSKFSWIWRGLVDVVRRAVPRCMAQARTT
jgi:hypothetical protein